MSMNQPVQLRCEYMTDPLGVGVACPRVSWELSDPRRGAVQCAYQVLVASSPALLADDQGDLWDSGKVSARTTAGIAYAGSPLSSRQRCYWKVRAWDGADAPSAWSETASWEMGLLQEADWAGQWMAYPHKETDLVPRPGYYFRRALSVAKPIVQARVYATARGLYMLRLNGQAVGDALFRPGWTEYRQRLQVDCYDITEQLQSGDNALAAQLGEGWYCGRVGWSGNRDIYGDHPSLYLQVEISYADGTTETITSDGEWKVSKGPIIASGFLLGETYDARQELPGWDTAGFNDAAWQAVNLSPRDAVPFTFMPYQPVRRIMELTPIAITEPTPGAFIMDLGQNMVGFARLRVSGAAGTQVTLRFGEMLNPDGTLYTENLRQATSTDHYILKGEGEECYEPTFTFHGFRYVEITGYPGTPGTESITGIVTHTDAPVSGAFECSNTMVNQLYRNIFWGQRGNFLEVPTDCPQRDERLGWMGDAQIFARTACYNMDIAAFFTKWMKDVNDAQRPEGWFTLVSPNILPVTPEEAKAVNFDWDVLYEGMAAWGDAGVIVPWVLYQFYNDTRVLEACYPHMARWVTYLEEHSTQLIRPSEGFGDWLSIDADTPNDVLATAYFAHCADLMARMAGVLGKTADAENYSRLFGDIVAAFNREFVSAETRIKGDTQTAYVLALAFNLLPNEGQRAQAAAHLASDIRARGNHLSCGFVGIGYLLPTLTAMGYVDLAYALLLQDTFPSWGYSIKHGATTIWERWDGWTHDKGFQTPGMNSFNHYSLGSVGEWLYASVLGIATDPHAPGFAHSIIHPRLGGGLSYAKGSYHTPHGVIATAWTLEGDRFTLSLTIPANTTAALYLPTVDIQTVTEQGAALSEAEGISNIHVVAGELCCEVAAGAYQFAVTQAACTCM